MQIQHSQKSASHNLVESEDEVSNWIQEIEKKRVQEEGAVSQGRYIYPNERPRNNLQCKLHHSCSTIFIARNGTPKFCKFFHSLPVGLLPKFIENSVLFP